MTHGRTLALLPLALVAATAAIAVETRDLMPVPAELAWKSNALPVDARFSISTSGPADSRVDHALARLGAFLKAEAKLASAPRVVRGTGGRLHVAWKSAGAPVQGVRDDESYELVVDATGARLTAPEPIGVLRGLETFRQLVHTEKDATTAAAVSIKDRPRFVWRGLLIDPCRHWEPVEVIKRTLDAMAAVKMNVLHWHLSEYQGFRIESKVFPKLQEMAGEGHFYTQEQVRDVLAYARDRGIRVVPEFDMPGHTTSFLVAYPDLGVPPGPYALRRTWDVFDETLDPSKEEVYDFIAKFWTEMAALFPDSYVHIGGDEVTPRAWNADARIQTFIYDHNLRDARDLQAYFNKRVIDILTKLDKKVVGWDEVLHPDLPGSAVVQSWRGVESLAAAARQGHDAILSAPYYLDHMRSAGYHYAADPIPDDNNLTPEEKAHVLGGEACMWGEFVIPSNIDSRLWPRAAAIAERLWSPSEVRDGADMYRRLELESRRLAALGLKHREVMEAGLLPLAGDQAVAPLRALAELLEPVKEYRRMELGSWNQSTPLDHLVDVVPPESDTARAFAESVRGYLAGTVDAAAVRAYLVAWSRIGSEVDPVLAANPKLAEVRTLARDIAGVANMLGECLSFNLTTRQVPRPWVRNAWAQLDAYEKPRGFMQLMLVPPMRKLVVATWEEAKLKPVPRAQWNQWLDDEIKSIQAKQAAGAVWP
jgi:hexosaminidase